MVETDEVTRDAFFGGRLILSQPAKGHRSGTDAVLLAAAVPRDFGGFAYDVGAGVGAVGLGVALACPTARVTLVENHPTCIALAADNIAENGLKARVTIAACDVLDHTARKGALTAPADLVVTNPPFHDAGRVRGPSAEGRRAAHILADGYRIEDWLRACLDCLGPKGELIVLHQPPAVPEMIGYLRSRLGGLTLMPIVPRSGESAVRILLRGRRGSRAPFRIAAPLVLHDDDRFTTVAARLHEGREPLTW